MAVRTPLVLGIDAGGTMTDTFIVDEAGGFEVGKAPTTPEDESVGFLESTEDAIHYWGMELEELFPKLEVTLLRHHDAEHAAHASGPTSWSSRHQRVR